MEETIEGDVGHIWRGLWRILIMVLLRVSPVLARSFSSSSYKLPELFVHLFLLDHEKRGKTTHYYIILRPVL